MNEETQVLFDEMIEQEVNREIEQKNNDILFGELEEWQRSVDRGDVSAKDFI